MRRGAKILSVVMMIILVTFIAPGNTSDAMNPMSRKIIVFQDGVEQMKKEKIIDVHKAKKIKDIKGINAVVVEVNQEVDFDDEQCVLFVEKDFVVSTYGKGKNVESSKKSKDDNDAVNQPEEVIPWGIDFVDAPELWSVTKGSNIKVAIIDTGIDIDHPDLIDNIKGGINTIKKKGSFDDDNGHGTHVAGIIGAVDNEIGVVGVTPEVDLFAVKSLDSNGDGYVSDIIEAIQWCIDNEMDIINMSFGIKEDSSILYDEILRANDKGIKMVAAAGNNHGDICEYPGLYEEVISVGALDAHGEISTMSAQVNVDVFAPGIEILSTFNDGLYATFDGTSMACPHYVAQIIKNMQQ